MKSSILDALVIMAVGGFFLIQALLIESSQDVLIGPHLVPTILASLIIFLGGLQLVLAFFVQTTEESDIEVPSKSVLTRMVIIICLGFAYIWLFSATGYLISTALVLCSVLVLFGNRSAKTLIITSILGSFMYYLLFIKLMGIYVEPGWLIDLSSLGL